MSFPAPSPNRALQTETCKFLLGYWQALRGARLLPAHADIDPASLSRFLPKIGLFEVRSPDLTICRLAGTGFRASLGFELTGRNVVHLYAADLHRAAGYRFWMMATKPCGAALVLPLVFSSGSANPHEVLLLPVAPNKPDGSTLLLVGIASFERLEWENAALLPQLSASPDFDFIDIGAGRPASTLPPADF
jgi:hypothetical protein